MAMIRRNSKRLQLHEFIKRSDFYHGGGERFRRSNTCLPGLDDPDNLITLTISDYNASGLGGPWNVGKFIKIS